MCTVGSHKVHDASAWEMSNGGNDVLSIQCAGDGDKEQAAAGV